jgi:hypothetical protein
MTHQTHHTPQQAVEPAVAVQGTSDLVKYSVKVFSGQKNTSRMDKVPAFRTPFLIPYATRKVKLTSEM